jgi:hypothetical protein
MADGHTLRTANMFNAPTHAAFDAWTGEEVAPALVSRRAQGPARSVVQNVDAKNQLRPWPKPVRRAS